MSDQCEIVIGRRSYILLIKMKSSEKPNLGIYIYIKRDKDRSKVIDIK